MNRQEAKRILAGYRPGSRDSEDPQVSEALQRAQNDPDLRQCFEYQSRFHQAVRSGFRAIPVPPDLTDQIMAHSKIVKVAWWRRPQVWAAAAAVILLAVLALQWQPYPSDDSFAVFRSRMVRTALREYRMDIVTNDLTQIRQFLAVNKAPADSPVLDRLSARNAVGAGLLRWHGDRVSMVCFDSGRQAMLFLFIVDRAAVKHPPPAETEFVPVNKLMTASWTEGDKAYVLAGASGILEEWSSGVVN